MLEELKRHAVMAAIMAAITITVLETLTGAIWDFVFNLLVIGLLVFVAKVSRRP